MSLKDVMSQIYNSNKFTRGTDAENSRKKYCLLFMGYKDTKVTEYYMGNDVHPSHFCRNKML